jgi:hypothetical protein
VSSPSPCHDLVVRHPSELDMTDNIFLVSECRPRATSMSVSDTPALNITQGKRTGNATPGQGQVTVAVVARRASCYPRLHQDVQTSTSGAAQPIGQVRRAVPSAETALKVQTPA